MNEVIGRLPKGTESFQLCDLQTVLAVAETGSFRKASLCLEVGQSSITRRVQKIEDTLGVSLFERHPNGARLTHAGRNFTAQMRAIVDDLLAAIETAQRAGFAGNGRLRLGSIVSLSQGIVRDVVETFLDQHREVDLQFAELDRRELLTELNHRRIDLVIAAGEPGIDVDYSLLLVRERVFLAVPDDASLARRERLDWSDLVDMTFLVSTRVPGPEIHDYIIQRVNGLGQLAEVQRHRLGCEGIMNLVGLGLGVSLVAGHWRGVQYPNVAFVPIGDEDERVPFSLTWRPENDNPALRRFVSLARVHAKKAAAGDAVSRTPDQLP